MSMTQTQVISNALALLGNKPVLSIQGQLSDIVQAAVQAYNFLINSVLSKGPWRFATKIVPLPQLVAKPPVPNWSSIYQLPGDYLKLIRLYPHTLSFEMYTGGQMYCNLSGDVALEYVFLPEQTAYPDYFNEYMVYEVATYLALSSAQSSQYYSPLMQARDYKMAQAMAADAQNRPSTPMISAPMVTNRFISSWGGY